jgi:large subunit ribosomal protein L31
MRDIHPAYPETTVTCACGNVIKTRSTRGDFTVDVCGACHPFYTGKQKLMDTAGRVDRFRKKFGDTQVSAKKANPAPAQQAKGEKKKAKEQQKAEKAEAKPEAAAAAPAAEEPKAN